MPGGRALYSQHDPARLLKNVRAHVAVQETKDLETTVAGIRADKLKAEIAEKAAKAKGAPCSRPSPPS